MTESDPAATGRGSGCGDFPHRGILAGHRQARRLRPGAKRREEREISDVTWNGKRVLVTGAGGFIGSHLTERLVALGADVRAFVHYNALGTWGWLDHSTVCGEIEVLAGDVTDRDSVCQAMQGVEIAFHLAALIGIPYSYHAPASYVRTNVEGHAERAPGRSGAGTGTRGAHLHQRGLRHRPLPCPSTRTIPFRASHRTPPARSAPTRWPSFPPLLSGCRWSRCVPLTPSARASRPAP